MFDAWFEPVGCGKSGVAAILPFGIGEGRVLVIAPNLAIKEELFKPLTSPTGRDAFGGNGGY